VCRRQIRHLLAELSVWTQHRSSEASSSEHELQRHQRPDDSHGWVQAPKGFLKNAVCALLHHVPLPPFLDTTFVNFRDVCSGEMNFMFLTNTLNEDLQHPVQVSGIKVVDSTEDAKVFVHRADVGSVDTHLPYTST